MGSVGARRLHPGPDPQPLKNLQSRRRITYLFISHNLGVIEHMSDRIAVMYFGRIVELAPRDALLSRPLHP